MILLGKVTGLASLTAMTRLCSAWWPGGLVAWWTSLGTSWLFSFKKSLRLPLMAASTSAQKRSSWRHDWTVIRGQLSRETHLYLPLPLECSNHPLDLLGHLLAQQVHQAACVGGADFGTSLLTLPRRQPPCLALASFPLTHCLRRGSETRNYQIGKLQDEDET